LPVTTNMSVVFTGYSSFLSQVIFHRGCPNRHSSLSFLYIFWCIDFGLCCLMQLSTIFQLFLVGTIYWLRKLEYPVKTTDMLVVTGKLYCSSIYFSSWISIYATQQTTVIYRAASILFSINNNNGVLFHC
jgi:hypothetical protein